MAENIDQGSGSHPSNHGDDARLQPEASQRPNDKTSSSPGKPPRKSARSFLDFPKPHRGDRFKQTADGRGRPPQEPRTKARLISHPEKRTNSPSDANEKPPKLGGFFSSLDSHSLAGNDQQTQRPSTVDGVPARKRLSPGPFRKSIRERIKQKYLRTMPDEETHSDGPLKELDPRFYRLALYGDKEIRAVRKHDALTSDGRRPPKRIFRTGLFHREENTEEANYIPGSECKGRAKSTEHPLLPELVNKRTRAHGRFSDARAELQIANDLDDPIKINNAKTELRKARKGLNDSSEALGQLGVALFVRKKYGSDAKVTWFDPSDARAITEEEMIRNVGQGKGLFDVICLVDQPSKQQEALYIVAEAKGGNSQPSYRWNQNGTTRVQQGTLEYFKTILNQMGKRGGKGNDLRNELRTANEQQQLGYVVVNTRVVTRRKSSEYEVSWRARSFDLGE